jgi:hypothetical protein
MHFIAFLYELFLKNSIFVTVFSFSCMDTSLIIYNLTYLVSNILSLLSLRVKFFSLNLYDSLILWIYETYIKLLLYWNSRFFIGIFVCFFIDKGLEIFFCYFLLGFLSMLMVWNVHAFVFWVKEQMVDGFFGAQSIISVLLEQMRD